MGDKVMIPRDLLERLRSYIPNGDGYNSQYANDLADAVEVLEDIYDPSPYRGLRIVGYASSGQMAILESGVCEGMKVKREQSARYDEPLCRLSDAGAALAARGADKDISSGDQGWRLVPIEPTREMLEAAEEAHMPFGDMDIALRLAILSAPDTPSTAPQHERDHVRKERDKLASHLEFAVTMLTMAGLSGNSQVSAMKDTLAELNK